MDDIILELKNKRLENGISQSKLAKLYGISPANLSAWELRKSTPNDIQLRYWEKAINDLIYLIESKKIDIKRKKTITGTRHIKAGQIEIDDVESYRKAIGKINRKKTEYTNCIDSIYNSHQTNQNEQDLKAISLFSGCGGLDLGFSAAGFSILGHIELDQSIEKIYRANFPFSISLGRDVTLLTDEDILSWKERFGDIDIIIGGPPCQGFSLAGKRNPEDARNTLYRYYANILRIIKPKVFIMENVSLLTSMKTKEGAFFIENIEREFTKSGYSLSIKELGVEMFGVPQSRSRIIIVGTREGERQFKYPTSTHGVISEIGHENCLFPEFVKRPYRTFRDATGDLPPLESGEVSEDPLHWAVSHPQHVIKWLINVPEGCSAHENSDPKLRPHSGFNTTYKRIKWDEPCSTISTNFGMISGSRNVHPSCTRSFTIREAARVQSFSDNFVFLGNWGGIRKAIGNAVPPLFAYILADSIRKQLFQR